MEEWKPIKDFPEYEVSNLGRVKGKYGKIIQCATNSVGYKQFGVYSGSVKSRKSLTLHRVLMEAFVENSENKPTVDHINQDRQDNRLENLRWADYQEQNLNRKKDNLACIYKREGRDYYFVQIKRNNKIICRESFEILEDAIVYRDSILHQMT